LPRLEPSPGQLKCVNSVNIPSAPETVPELRATLRPLGLNYWLQDVANN